ncbi:MAG: hypothetical protein ACI3ZF_02010 [Candidatus Cryptobacteroides sp.]
MGKRTLLILTLSLLPLLSLQAEEGPAFCISRAGLVSSFKSQSISVLSTSDRKENSFNSFNLALDTYGLYSNISSIPGVKLNIVHNSIINSGQINKEFAYIIYMGAGGVAGYVRDYSTLPRNHGFIFGLNTCAGALASFRSSRLELGIEFDAEWAFQIRKMEETDGRIGLSWYANGVIRAIIPKITLYYRFK